MGGSGTGGNGNGGAGGANGGMGGAETSSGAAGNGDEPWGLPTGGGGCTCSLGAQDKGVGFAASLVIGALVMGRRRQRRNA